MLAVGFIPSRGRLVDPAAACDHQRVCSHLLRVDGAPPARPRVGRIRVCPGLLCVSRTPVRVSRTPVRVPDSCACPGLLCVRLGQSLSRSFCISARCRRFLFSRAILSACSISR